MRSITFKPDALPWVDPSQKIDPTCIVLHWWGEPINDRGVHSLIEVLQSRQLSVQFAILVSGEIVQLTPSSRTFCRHAKCANVSSIGIEIEGHNAVDLDTNKVQYASVIKLMRYLVKKYSIEINFRVVKDQTTTRFYGVASHKLVDTFCEDSNGKDDVHDEYIERVRRDLAL